MATAQALDLADTTIAETTGGRVRGVVREGIHIFKGIPYGATTGGANRFRPPRPLAPWSGVREAIDYGPTAPQVVTPPHPIFAWTRRAVPIGEDCLVANVFTPGLDGARRPVMVWLHGGALAVGSGSGPAIDGTILAGHGDVVVVSVNHRLNAFGYAYFGDGDERFADSGNAGMLDLVAALQWVKTNIASFGGDPGNVTIFGQSGGATKVALLMNMPAAKGLFHKAIAQSASSALGMPTPGVALAASRRLMSELGLAGKGPEALATVPAGALLTAMTAAIAANGGYDDFFPVVDGRALPHQPFDLGAADESPDVPLLVGSTDTEATFFLLPDMGNFDLSEQQVERRLVRFLGADAASVRDAIAEYRARRPGDSPADILIAMASDRMYRGTAVGLAERKAAQGGAPAYAYLFTWRTPILGGVLKSPHTVEIPYVFGTIDIAVPTTGSGPDRAALMDTMMATWLAFARTGDPNNAALPSWRPYGLPERTTMELNGAPQILRDPGRADLKTLKRFRDYRGGTPRLYAVDA